MGFKTLALVPLAVLALLPAAPAKADDLGCTLFLCLAAPGGNWGGISQCVPPVKQAFGKMLYEGWTPSCAFQNSDGSLNPNSYFVTGSGVTQPSCQDAYGPGWSKVNDTEDYTVEPGQKTVKKTDTSYCENSATGQDQPLPATQGTAGVNWIDIYVNGVKFSRTYWTATDATQP